MQKYIDKLLNNISRPLNNIEYILCSLLLSIPVAYYTSTYKITIAMGGYRVFLIKFSWWLGIITIAWILWGIMFFLSKKLKAEVGPKLSASCFIFSHACAYIFIASSFAHFYLFQEHWSIDNLTTAITGITAGKAPVELPLIQIAMVAVLLVLAITLLLFLLKFFNFITQGFAHIRYQSAALLVAGILSLLTAFQHVIQPNWHSSEIQKQIPWFNFIGSYDKYQQSWFGLADLHFNEAERQAVMQRLSQFSAADNIQAKHDFDILILHVEALRSDLFNPENMPQVYDLVQQNKNIKPLLQHYSSSNNSGNSVFGIMNGLSGMFYQEIRGQDYTPVPLRLLRALGYQTKLHATIDTSYQDIKKLSFPDVDESTVTDGSMIDREQKMVDNFRQDLSAIRTIDTAPRFDYMIFNSTHFPYHYPKSFAHFSPAMHTDISYKPSQRGMLEKNKKMLENRFKNSVLYADDLIKQVFDALKETERLQNTFVIVVGDHGQEFWEHNRFGHNFSFVNEQTQVVGLIYSPIDFSLEYSVTNHHDFMPTLFSLMQINIDIKAIMDGKNLASFNERRDFSTSSMGVVNNQKRYEGIVTGEGIKVRYLLNDELLIKNITTKEDEPLASPPIDSAADLVRRAVETKRKLLVNRI